MAAKNDTKNDSKAATKTSEKDAQSAQAAAAEEREAKKAAKVAEQEQARKAAIDAGDLIVDGDNEWNVASVNSTTKTQTRAAQFLGMVKNATKTPLRLDEATERLGCYPDAVQFWTAILEQQGLIKRFSLTSSEAKGKKPQAVLYIG